MSIWLEIKFKSIVFYKHQFALIIQQFSINTNRINCLINKSLRIFFLKTIYFLLLFFFFLHLRKVGLKTYIKSKFMCYADFKMHMIKNQMVKNVFKNTWNYIKYIWHEQCKKSIKPFAKKKFLCVQRHSTGHVQKLFLPIYFVDFF